MSKTRVRPCRPSLLGSLKSVAALEGGRRREPLPARAKETIAVTQLTSLQPFRFDVAQNKKALPLQFFAGSNLKRYALTIKLGGEVTPKLGLPITNAWTACA